MKFFPALTFALIVLLVPWIGNAQEPTDRNALFTQANQLYEQQEFEKARDLYLQLTGDGDFAEEVFYNLGNCYFRLGKAGRSVLWYRRALELNPRLAAASQNIRLVQKKTGLLEFETSQLARLSAHLSRPQWNLFIAISAWVIILAIAAMIVVKTSRRLGALWWTLVVVGLLALTLSITGRIFHQEHVDPEQLAVILDENINALAGPYPDASSNISLPPGSMVRLKLERGTWWHVEAPGDTAGWVPTESLAPVRPFTATR